MTQGDSLSSGRIALRIFVVCFLAFLYFFQSGHDSENARFGQIRALVEQGAWYIETSGTSSVDTIAYNGHFYPSMAPGLTIMAFPIWYAASQVMRLFNLPDNNRLHFVCYFVSVFTSGISTALLAALIFLVAELGFRDRWAGTVAALGYGLGSLAFPFGTLFLSHQVTAFMGFAAFALLFALQHAGDESWVGWLKRHRARTILLAGVLCGYVVVCEYSATIIAVILTLYAWATLPSWRDRLIFVVACMVGVLPLLAYNIAAFDNPVFFNYGSGEQGASPEHCQRFMGVALPSLGALYEITFGSPLAIFRLNPWFLIVLPGVCSIRSCLKAWFVALAIVIGILLFSASYGSSITFCSGGASIGPPHVVPMLPFLALLAIPALCSHWVRIIAYPLILYSVACMFMAAATEPRLGCEYNSPVTDLFWYQYIRANFSSWWGTIFGGPFLTENSVSFNLGKLVGLPPAAQLLPLYAILGKLASDLRRAMVLGRLENTVIFLASTVLLVFAFIPAGFAAHELFSGRTSYGLLGIVCPLRHEKQNSLRYSPLECWPPIARRVDEQLVFPPFSKSFSQSGTMVEWRGYLYVPESARWVIGADSDGDFAVYLDDTLFVETGVRHPHKREKRAAELEAGLHEIAVRYVNSDAAGTFTLLWSKFGQHMHPIPKRFFTLTKEHL